MIPYRKCVFFFGAETHGRKSVPIELKSRFLHGTLGAYLKGTFFFAAAAAARIEPDPGEGKTKTKAKGGCR